MNSEAVQKTLELIKERDEFDSLLGNAKEGHLARQVLLDSRKTVQAKLQQQKSAIDEMLQSLLDLRQKMDDNTADDGSPHPTNAADDARVQALMTAIAAKVELPDHYESSAMPSTELDASPGAAEIDHPAPMASPTVTAASGVSFPSMEQSSTEAIAVGALVPNPVFNFPDVKPFRPRSEFDDFSEAPQGPVLEPRTSKAAPKPQKSKQKATATTRKPTRAAAGAKPKKGASATTKTIAKPQKTPATAHQPRARQLMVANGAVSSNAGASADQKLTKIGFADFDRHCREIASQCNGSRYGCKLCQAQIVIDDREDALRHLMKHCDDPRASKDQFDRLMDDYCPPW